MLLLFLLIQPELVVPQNQQIFQDTLGGKELKREHRVLPS